MVDDGSKDNTTKIGFEYINKYGLDVIRLLKQGVNQGKGAAVRKVIFCARSWYRHLEAFVISIMLNVVRWTVPITGGVFARVCILWYVLCLLFTRCYQLKYSSFHSEILWLQGMLCSRGQLLLMLDADGASRITDLEKLEAQVSCHWLYSIPTLLFQDNSGISCCGSGRECCNQPSLTSRSLCSRLHVTEHYH